MGQQQSGVIYILLGEPLLLLVIFGGGGVGGYEDAKRWNPAPGGRESLENGDLWVDEKKKLPPLRKLCGRANWREKILGFGKTPELWSVPR